MYFNLHCALQQSLVRVKHPIPAQEETGVVYRIPCGTCPKLYIGQTGNTMMEHTSALKSGEAAQSQW